MDAWCTHIREGERNSHGEYLEALKRKRSELRSIAQENVSRNLGKARARYNEDKRESDIVVGEQVMLKSGQLKDSLSPRHRPVSSTPKERTGHQGSTGTNGQVGARR